MEKLKFGWLKFVSVVRMNYGPDHYRAYFEVDGAPVEHIVHVTEHMGIRGASGTSFFAMLDRGWKDLEEKELNQREVSRMINEALKIPRT